MEGRRRGPICSPRVISAEGGVGWVEGASLSVFAPFPPCDRYSAPRGAPCQPRPPVVLQGSRGLPHALPLPSPSFPLFFSAPSSGATVENPVGGGWQKRMTRPSFQAGFLRLSETTFHLKLPCTSLPSPAPAFAHPSPGWPPYRHVYVAGNETPGLYCNPAKLTAFSPLSQLLHSPEPSPDDRLTVRRPIPEFLP